MTIAKDGDIRAVVEDLETQLDALKRKVISMEKSVAEITALGEDFWRREAAAILIGAPILSWRYDAKDENSLFSDVYKSESFGSERARRWVGGTGEIEATIAINRTNDLIFSVLVQDFASQELLETFTLEIDGVPTPWMSADTGVWTALIDARPYHAHLKFSLRVDRSRIPSNKSKAFSFSEIKVVPHAVPNLTPSSELEHDDPFAT